MTKLILGFIIVSIFRNIIRRKDSYKADLEHYNDMNG